ncbi:hypothetical protein [Stenotrophomonas terrae]|uniref:hypothetical protein n=1 Tax=Stenotrophomonas terrae TaxID=405446 RepID=UPI000B1869E0|nr:hypothetical protein [Stenotrophomonas terrae]
MRRWIFIFALFFTFNAYAGELSRQPARALFVGNSLIYVGNLPATYAALSSANGHPVHSQMIVKGGAHLHQRVADGSVQRALSEHRPELLILQEQGGALLCLPDASSCTKSQAAIAALAKTGSDAGARVLLLGSYQSQAAASARLIAKEAAAAEQAGIPYVAISEALRTASAAAPDLPWYDADGMHPGPALTLLDAIQLFRVIHGRLPEHGFSVAAPIYLPKSGLDATLRDANAAAPLADTPTHINYPDAMVQRINAILRTTPP